MRRPTRPRCPHGLTRTEARRATSMVPRPLTSRTFVEVGRRHYGGNLAGKWILTAGLGGTGGAPPLSATVARAAVLATQCHARRNEKRVRTGYPHPPANTARQGAPVVGAA